MTIQDLWHLLDHEYDAGKELLSPLELRGYRVAIDFHNQMYACRAVVRSSLIYSRNIVTHPLNEEEIDTLWLQELTRRILGMMCNGITPVLVIDGPAPEEKANTREERAAAKQKIIQRIQAEMSRDLLREGREVLREVRKLMLQLNYIPQNSVEQAIHFFGELGIQVLQSNTDGERLCSSLCIEGYVAAVLSTDSDNLAHGAPVILRGWGPEIPGDGNGGQSMNYYRVVRLPYILQRMRISNASFLDFCILCGCDYNKRVRGIGAKKGLALIMKHGNLEEVVGAIAPRDTTALNFERCRALYEKVPSSQLLKEGQTLHWEVRAPDGKYLHDLLSNYGVTHLWDKIVNTFQQLPPARNFNHFRRDLMNFDGQMVEVVTASHNVLNVVVMQQQGETSQFQDEVAGE